MPPRYSFESEQQAYQTSSSPPPPRYQSPPPSNPPLHLDTTVTQPPPAQQYKLPRGTPGLAQNYGEIVNAPPPPPQHRTKEGRAWGKDPIHTTSAYSNVTSGADNFGDQAQGGMTGLAYGVADANARESGMDAMRNTPGYDSREMSPYEESPYRPGYQQEVSSSSLTPLNAAAFPPGTPSMHSTVSRSNMSLQDPYSDVYYNRHSRNMNPNMEFDPNSIEDDGDDGLEYRSNQRGSTMNLGQNGNRGAAVAGGAAAGGIMGSIGSLVGRNQSQNGSQYDPVGGPSTAYNGPNDYDLGRREKKEWLEEERRGNKKRALIAGIVIAVLVAAALVGGVAGGLVHRGGSSDSQTQQKGQTATSDTTTNGDLTKDSTEIKALMANTKLHKVFPGVDYTPIHSQYPDCIHDPPSQNNVTRDLAVLSQLTNVVRLYGTDCNQTEMLIHSIDKLDLKGTVKIWLGVWQDTNVTTNARQLEQMYDILDTYGGDNFLGVIVGNEVLFREDMDATELGTVISNVRSNLTSKGLGDLKIASSDLGDNWTKAPELVEKVDYIMANIHPFFAGVPSTQASSWTNTFFQNNDAPLKSDASHAIIGETGWPSGGGTDCGTDTVTVCPNAAVAGVTEMNTFMDDFVCSALSNGTNYFWFSAFDEPWKIMFNEDGKEWEDKWGLMDVNRNLKPGVVIPDCGGTQVGPASA
ncbi:endo-beta-glucanase [Phlyctema vagabunda]|uniref:glucan endo-1,3-beta-D-glucosidase n=1 Tax=Phlyctema vagabunda TaxID=108571 RepID=A0ABR4PHD2_9HELO